MQTFGFRNWGRRSEDRISILWSSRVRQYREIISTGQFPTGPPLEVFFRGTTAGFAKGLAAPKLRERKVLLKR